MHSSELKTLLRDANPEFWDRLAVASREATDFSELFQLSSLRKKAHTRQIPRKETVHEKVRLALLGGYSLYPLHDLVEHLCDVEGFPCTVWLGDFDNYISEIMDDGSALYEFGPQVILLLPAEHRCKYTGQLTDPRQMPQDAARQVVYSLLELAGQLHEKTRAEVIMTNFMLPARHDLGAYRARTIASDWTFRKWVNLELGLSAPPYLHVCDLEFLAHRRGGIEARDERAWFESKQPCSPALLPDLAREIVHLLRNLRRAPKKVLALDLDNTLWGGVVADDGIDGIELGDTSPRGEAFKAFQKYIVTLKQRGTLLAVVSKNDHAVAAEVFEKHPEMVLRMEDVVFFKANWEPKSDNLRRMAAELELGLDSFVFVDDNPAEIEIVRQFAPEVATILLGPDPSEYVAQLQDCRYFEPRNITSEDTERTAQYRSESQRQALLAATTDMGAYLESLNMEAVIREFAPVDIPRVAQLINKSNQFNLTTRRRSEAELTVLMNDPSFIGFSVRLRDRFGDHGLISVAIGRQDGDALHIDTWLMSCRVLKRQVEDEVLNELVRLGKTRGCTRIEGLYLPTSKNTMVADFYSEMGFALVFSDEQGRRYNLPIDPFPSHPTKIKLARRAYEPN
ncbi:MAG: HAD-IIIC family phosphatase [Chthoniobacter sp.]|uniref:HAD-IIIC family phosphatase n=1 Tax=Chthoniobacter sp. TaxID=2510640 RepID=UPI0032AD12AD